MTDSTPSVSVLVGDCRERMSECHGVDAVITDPVWPNAPDGMFPQVDDAAGLFATAMSSLPPSVKRVVVVLRSDSDPRFLSGMPSRWPFFNVSWLQYVMPGFYGRLLGGNEVAYAFGEPVPSAPGRRVIPSLAPKAQPAKRSDHPCPRALVHMRWLVHWWSDPHETVLDPFAGIGTIGVACAELGRRAILIERSEQYAVTASRRLAAVQPPLTT